MKKIISEILFLPRIPFLFLIKIYQKTLSPDYGFFKFLHPNGFCKFYPTCSQYGYEVIKKRGLSVGIPKTIWRILRCNPWSRGGVDLPDTPACCHINIEHTNISRNIFEQE